MAIAYRNSSTQGSDSSETTASVSAPSGAAEGDIALVFISQYNGGGAISPPSGWSTSFSRTARTTGSTTYSSLFYKVLGAGESWPKSFTWTGGCPWAAVCLAFSGGDGANPFDVVPNGLEANADPISHTGITTNYANSMLVMIACNQQTAPQFSAWSSPLVERVDYQTGWPDAIGAATGVQASAAASGTKEVTQAGGAVYHNAWLMALRESGGTNGDVTAEDAAALASVGIPAVDVLMPASIHSIITL